MLKRVKNAILKKIFGLVEESKVQRLQLRIKELERRTPCYSLEGEDLIVATFLQNVEKGFYIDVGSYHPIRYSNTYLFYLRGWTGINIDPRPGSMDVFNEIRPKDINLEVAIGNHERTLEYYMFDEPALNSFSKEVSEDRHNNTLYKIQKKVNIPLKRLDSVLNEYLPHNTAISFMSVDVEGFDLEVLESNDWTNYRPLVILVETSILSEGNDVENPIHCFLKDRDYQLVAKTFRTSVYKRRE